MVNSLQPAILTTVCINLVPAMKSNDPVPTYFSPFQNSIHNTGSSVATMSEQDHLQGDPSLQRFTATGRPMPKLADSARGRGMNALASSESFGAGAPNLLPTRFTDDSIISVPVLPPPGTSKKLSKSDDDDDGNPIKMPKSRFSFFRRKSSSLSKKKDDDDDFVMKEMTRLDYLKHYAKDDNGKYIGTEKPAADCILKNEEDRIKYRNPRKHRGSTNALGVDGYAFTAGPGF